MTLAQFVSRLNIRLSQRSIGESEHLEAAIRHLTSCVETGFSHREPVFITTTHLELLTNAVRDLARCNDLYPEIEEDQEGLYTFRQLAAAHLARGNQGRLTNPL